MRRRSTWRPAPATPGQVLAALAAGTTLAVGLAGSAGLIVYSWGLG